MSPGTLDPDTSSLDKAKLLVILYSDTMPSRSYSIKYYVTRAWYVGIWSAARPGSGSAHEKRHPPLSHTLPDLPKMLLNYAVVALLTNHVDCGDLQQLGVLARRWGPT